MWMQNGRKDIWRHSWLGPVTSHCVTHIRSLPPRAPQSLLCEFTAQSRGRPGSLRISLLLPSLCKKRLFLFQIVEIENLRKKKLEPKEKKTGLCEKQA